MTLVSKIKNNLNPPIMDFMFERRNNTYNRNFQDFATKRKRTVKMSLEMMVNFADDDHFYNNGQFCQKT